MGEKKGGMFNIVLVVVIASILIAVLTYFVPVILDQITEGMQDQVTTGFGYVCDADGECGPPATP